MYQIYFILFWSNTLHVSGGLSVRNKTVRTTTGICQTDTALYLLASRQQYLFDICMLLYVQSWTPDDGRKDRPKHVECYSKIKWNKFDTLVHLVGFTIQIYYDAQPYEGQIAVTSLYYYYYYYYYYKSISHGFGYVLLLITRTHILTTGKRKI